jgi:hypothetical protein
MLFSVLGFLTRAEKGCNSNIQWLLESAAAAVDAPWLLPAAINVSTCSCRFAARCLLRARSGACLCQSY